MKALSRRDLVWLAVAVLVLVAWFVMVLSTPLPERRHRALVKRVESTVESMIEGDRR